MAKSDDGSGKGDRDGIDWRTLHLWQIQPVRDVLLVLAIFGFLYFGYLISVVTIPLLLALLFAYLFEPVVQRMTRISWVSRQGSAAAIIAAAVVVIVVPLVLGVGFAIVQGAQFAQEFAGNTRQLVASIEDPDDEQALARLPEQGVWRQIRTAVLEAEAAEQAERAAAAAAKEEAESETPPEGEGEPPPAEESPQDDDAGLADFDVMSAVYVVAYDALRYAGGWIEQNREVAGRRAIATGQGALNAAIDALTRVSVVGFGAFLTAFFFFFMSSSFGNVLHFFRELLPDEQESRIIDLASKMDAVIAGFVRGRLTIAAIQSVIFVIAYWAIGVPAPLILGPIVGILSIVPYVALVGIPISVVLLALDPGTGWQSQWWWILGAPVAVYFIVQALDDYVWTPLIQGKSTNMETPFILFASLAGGALAGVYGLLLGIPVAACAKILITEVVWPRFEAWKQGKAVDPLPFGGKNKE